MWEVLIDRMTAFLQHLQILSRFRWHLCDQLQVQLQVQLPRHLQLCRK